MNKQHKTLILLIGIFLIAILIIGFMRSNKNMALTGQAIADLENTEQIKQTGNTEQSEPIEQKETQLNQTKELVRFPLYYTDMQEFIRPEEAEPFLKNFNLNEENIHDNLAKLMTSMKITYSHDKAEYWQTPTETLKTRRGDCEDWAIAKTSLIRAYNPKINCYVILWNTHASVLYHIPGTNAFTIYDQGNIYKNIVLDDNPDNEYIITQENKINFRVNLKNYFKEYGLDSDDGKIQALFNDKEVIIFEDNEDLINWALEKIKD